MASGWRRVGLAVPATSLGRRRLAEALQEQWRSAGVAATVTAADFLVLVDPYSWLSGLGQIGLRRH